MYFICNSLLEILYLPLQYDEKSLMYVTRYGNHTASPIEDVHNNHLYSGNENEITISRVFATTFSCEFYLTYYPFDIQGSSNRLKNGICVKCSPAAGGGQDAGITLT